jgi:hypothetical protein
MAINNNGPGGMFNGRLGNIVYYTLNGRQVSRTIGKRLNKPTDNQIKARATTKMCSELLNHFRSMFDVGFSIEAQGTDLNSFNIAVKVNRKLMFGGDYSNYSINYSKLIFSRGVLNPGENLELSNTNDTITFKWKTDDKMQWPESADQVMMLAYFPGQNKVVHKIHGNVRKAGSDQLHLPPSLRGVYAETYIAFVSADRKAVSNSTYTGSINPLNSQ